MRRRGLRTIGLALVLPIAFASLALAPQAASLTAEISESIRARLDAVRSRHPSEGRAVLHARGALAGFYERRQYQPAWITEVGVRPAAADLVRELGAAGAEGLRPGDYHLETLVRSVQRTTRAVRTLDGLALAELDLMLSDAFLLYASHLSAGRVDPDALNAGWHATRPDIDTVRLLEQVVDGHSVSAVLASVLPQHPHYGRLKAALARFEAVERAGGWPLVPIEGGRLELGMHGARVRALRARLVAAGDLGPGEAIADVFDQGLAAAVRRFQYRHGLDRDGIVGPATLAALNVPVERRIEQVKLNLERWRWLPPELGPRYVLVNIPAFELEVVEEGRPVMAMRVVVGRDYRRTPVFSGTMTYLVLNPYWSVPRNIAVRDLLPRIQEDPGYFAAQGIRVFLASDARSQEVDRSAVKWSALTPDNFPYSLRQDPGPANALGAVKFMFPNRFNVYLHDSPARDLFAQTERDFSSGCVRIERPRELAAYLLRDDPAWTPGRLDERLATAFNQTVSLPRPIPVHVLYWTSWADDDGVHFRRDLYGRDAALQAALNELPLSEDV